MLILNLLLGLTLICLLCGFLLLFVFLKKALPGRTDDVQALVDRVFGASAQKAAEQSRQLLAADREVIKTDLNDKHQELARLVKNLETVVDRRQQEIKTLEKERAEQFGSLAKQISNQQRVTDQLSMTTQSLARVLSNNQQRGGWGERLIEDMLVSNGLKEGVHYQLQTKLGSTEHKPDVTLLLPNHRVVPVDVKFPFVALQQYASSDVKEAKLGYKKQFASDVKKHIDKVAGYILPEEGTLDYVVIFVPNEAVFSFLNQNLPELVDYAIAKRVLMTSPFTFLIVARTIMESYRNFLLGDRLRGVLDQIDGFLTEWQKYKLAMDKFGKNITTLKNSHEELMGTRFRQLDKKVSKVSQLGQAALKQQAEKKLVTAEKT